MMNNFDRTQKGHIQYQIGSIYDLFQESKVNIHDLSRVYLHYGQKYKSFIGGLNGIV